MCISCSILHEQALCPIYVLYHGIRCHYKIIILCKKKIKIKSTWSHYISSYHKHGTAIVCKKKMLKSGKVLKHSDWVKQSMIIKCWLFFNKSIYHSLKVIWSYVTCYLLCMLLPLSGEPLLQRIFIHSWSICSVESLSLTIVHSMATSQICFKYWLL